MKDKIKEPKQIDEYTSIVKPNDPQLTQCPKCLSLFNISFKHECKLGWKWCSICGLDLHKKGKEHLINGIKYVSLRYKKSYNIMDKIICWNCAFKMVKEFKKNDL